MLSILAPENGEAGELCSGRVLGKWPVFVFGGGVGGMVWVGVSCGEMGVEVGGRL
jgi:hypothetical protein